MQATHLHNEDYSCDSMTGRNSSEKEDTLKLKENLKIELIYKTSAKTGENIKQAIGSLVKEILKEGSYIER